MFIRACNPPSATKQMKQNFSTNKNESLGR
uniref:Uncharacterized protein n=1 Tax=Rhizophora mucronata TaxID=61149 RepID=A0A2P2QDE2_RHIMU